MGYKWLGPYSIKQILGNGLYSVKDLCTKQVILRVNGCHLKPSYQDQSRYKKLCIHNLSIIINIAVISYSCQ